MLQVSVRRCALATVTTSLAGVSAIKVGRETTVRYPASTVLGSTAHSTVDVSTDDASVMPDSPEWTASTVCFPACLRHPFFFAVQFIP